MSAFEFFFSFYGLILGLSVVELVGGVARLLHDGKGVRIGWLTPLLGVYVAADITSFWVDAWRDMRGIEVGYAALIGALVVAGLYYIAASLVFPRTPSNWTSLDDHFWRHRRTVLVAVMICNLPLHILAFMERSLNDSLVVTVIYYGALGLAAFGRTPVRVMTGLGVVIALYAATVAANLFGPF